VSPIDERDLRGERLRIQFVVLGERRFEDRIQAAQRLAAWSSQVGTTHIGLLCGCHGLEQTGSQPYHSCILQKCPSIQAVPSGIVFHMSVSSSL